MNLPRLLPLLIAVPIASAARGAGDLKLDAQSTFTGPYATTQTMTVDLQNDGPDAVGALRVTGETGDVTYPVELPRGARKRIVTLNDERWGTLRFTLQTNRGKVNLQANAMGFGDEPGGIVALVGDDNGGLGFLRQGTIEGKRTYQAHDVYVRGEDAPDRPTAYRPFNAVFLGPGAERMTDEAVEALKAYALGGGTVVVLGGASAPVLSDRRWADALPGRDWRPENVSTSSALAKLGGDPVPGPFTVSLPGSLAPGVIADRTKGDTFETARGFGLGRVVVLGYSPLEAPMSAWSGRAHVVSRFIRGGDGLRARQFVASYLHQGGQTMNYATSSVIRGGRTIYRTSSSYGVGYSSTADNPFSTTLPAASTVFGILTLYFVLVVPVSFLVLRKMKRGELAWITAPLLSLGFAGVLFKSAESLYAAALSTASRGVIVVQQGQPEAMFYGTSQMFFPRGGSYDLRLHNVDSLSSVQTQDYYGGSDSLAGFNPVDVGQIVVPALEANNLAFREMSFSQRIDDADWFRFRRLDDSVEVENRSPYAFTGEFVQGDYLESVNVSIAPGAKAVVPLATGPRLAKDAALSGIDAQNFTRTSGRVALSGRVQGFRPGPQVGQEVASQSGISLVAIGEVPAR